MTICGSWSFTANDPPLCVRRFHQAAGRHPFLDKRTLCRFNADGVSRAVADAMAMKTVKSTIVRCPELLE